jgi:hypothetical protein
MSETKKECIFRMNRLFGKSCIKEKCRIYREEEGYKCPFDEIISMISNAGIMLSDAKWSNQRTSGRYR